MDIIQPNVQQHPQTFNKKIRNGPIQQDEIVYQLPKVQEPPSTLNKNMQTGPIYEQEILYQLPNPNDKPPIPNRMQTQNLQLTNENLQNPIAIGNTVVIIPNVQENRNDQVQRPWFRFPNLNKQTKIMFMCLIINTAVIIILVACVIYLLDRQASTSQLLSNTLSPSNYSRNPDQNTQKIKNYLLSEQFICQVYSRQCKDVPSSVRDYIFQNYTETNKIRATLQISRSLRDLNSIQQSPNYNDYIQNRISFGKAYTNLTQSVECLSYLLPDNFSQVFQVILGLHFTTKQQVQMYFNMVESSSGQPYKKYALQDIKKSCKFSLIPDNKNYRLLQKQIMNERRLQYDQATCSQNESEMILFINSNGYGPNAMVKTLKLIQSILNTNQSTQSLSNNIVGMGIYKSISSYQNFANFPSDFEKYLVLVGSAVPSKTSMFRTLQFLNAQTANISLPSDFNKEMFSQIVKFYIRKSAQSLLANQNIYDFTRHHAFIVQQLNEGNKVIVLAHGEGAIFANKLSTLLSVQQRQSVKFVYLGPIAANMPDGKPDYITHPNDNIIQYLNSIWKNNINFPIPLSANVDSINIKQQQQINHQHDAAYYLEKYKLQFIDLVVKARSSAAVPNKIFLTGPITINLVWDNVNTNLNFSLFCAGSCNGTNLSRVETVNQQNRRISHFVSSCEILQGQYLLSLTTQYGGYYYWSVTVNYILIISLGNLIHVATKSSATVSYYNNFQTSFKVNFDPQTRSNQFELFINQ